MAAKQDAAELAIQETLRRARFVFASGAGTTLSILKEADQRLSDKLHGIVQKHGGPSGTFTEASATAYRHHVQVSIAYLERRMLGHTHEQATKAIKAGVKNAVQVTRKLEKHFTGLTRPLALDAQHMQDETVRGVGASLLRKHQTSVARYGKALIGDFERVIRVSQLEGLSQHETISRLVSQGKLGGVNAKALHAKEPAYFPEPTGIVKKRYWAERIIRTEVAHAYNAAELQAMNVTRANDFPDLQKKILATFDMRTAPDSVAVHGQIRPLEGYFQDGAGRTYLHPPARPNDRETVVPWRPHWEETETSSPPPPKAQAEAQVAADPAGASEAGKKRWQQLGMALDQAKAKLAQQKAAKKQAQADLMAQAKAAAKPKPVPPLYTGAVPASHAIVPLQTAAHQKARELVRLQVAQAKAKAEAARAAKAAHRKTTAQDLLLDFKDSMASAEMTPKQALDYLKGFVKSDPHLFVEMWKQTTGKAPQKLLESLGKPMLVGKAAKEIAKKAVPDVQWTPPKKPKKPKAPLVELPKDEALKHLKTPEGMKQLEAAFAEIPTVTAENAAQMAAMSKKSPAIAEGFLDAAKEWDAKVKHAGTLDFKDGGGGYVDLYEGTQKVAYIKQAGDKFSVTPPVGVKQYPGGPDFPPLETTDKVKAAAYALDVSKEIQKAKGLVPKASIPPPIGTKPKPKPATPPGEMPWSKAYKPPKRKVADLGDPAKDLAKHLKEDRHGHSLALDKDWIENFDVSFSYEETASKGREMVVRFKVNQHRADELLENLDRMTPASSEDYGYQRLSSLQSGKLVKNDQIHERPHGASATVADHKGARIAYLESRTKSGDGLAATHNLVEIRVPAPKGKPDFGKVREVMGDLGIDATRPQAADLSAYKRAKIMAYADPDSARDLRQLKDRSPAALDKAWEKAVKRNPWLAEVESTAELREVSPGHHALYSDAIAKRYEEAGVTHLKHSISGSLEVVEQMLIHDPTAGLLSSRERFQRGLTFTGMSTEQDFVTGGADSVFLRLSTSTRPQAEARWMVEVDTKELGRLDSYVYNFDNYGRAGSGSVSDRETVQSMADRARNNQLSGSNEIMIQRQVGAQSIRRIVTNSANRAQLLERLRQAKIEEVNGIPIEDFVASGS